MTTGTVMPTLARALFNQIAEHLKAEAERTGYEHWEYPAGHQFPPVMVRCLPETVAEQIIEKHLTEVLGDTPCEPYFVEAS